MVSEHVELFLKDFPGVVPGPFPDQSLELHLGHRLPRTMLDFMTEYGFSGFGHGLFWLVDPQRWAPVVERLLEVSELPRPVGELTAFGRSAFGTVHCWSQQTGLVVFSPVLGHVLVDDTSAELPHDAELVAGSFFSIARPDSFDMVDEDGEPLFERAYARLGELTCDEVYGLLPTYRMGGELAVQNLRRVDALAHLVILSEL